MKRTVPVNNKKSRQIGRVFEILMVLVLALYPLRHIHRGLDLWDVGYNYANFQFMGTESMDPMWLFSTYLATALGHLFTLLPFGKTLLGLNFYTGLTVSLMAVAAYIFCTRHLKYPPFVVFIGEFTAISLCWCPTALLYNYLTYILLLIGVINIYLGLTGERRRNLYVAGICLGLNVFVRFSNLPEAAFIVGVWAYGIIELISVIKEKTKTKAGRRHDIGDFFKKTGKRTFWCLFGYLSAVFGMLLFIGLRYGINEYIDGIKRLFQMTDDAPGYSAVSMVMGIFYAYLNNLKWVLLVLSFALVCAVLVFAGKLLDAQLEIKRTVRGPLTAGFSFTGVSYILSIFTAIVMIYVLYTIRLGDGTYSGFGYGNLMEYNSIIVPGIFMCFVMVLWAVAVIFKPGEDIREKLMAGLAFLTIMITPIGSNNVLLPVFNNLFLAAPWFAWRIWMLIKRKERDGIRIRLYLKENREKKVMVKFLEITKSFLSYFPLKVITVAVMLLAFVRFTAFGAGFSFAEARNATDCHYTINENDTLRNVRMSYDKAYNMYGLLNFIGENDLARDRELITYGYIPALSFYLQMPSAFNPWMDLASYSYDVMQVEIEKTILDVISEETNVNLGEDVENPETKNSPMIILSSELGKYADGYKDETEREEISDRKFKLILGLIDSGGYREVYKNSSFAVFVNGR